MAAVWLGSGAVDGHAGGIGRTGKRHRHHAVGRPVCRYSHPEQSAGANQPYQQGYTGLDILNWNPDADKDSEYLRSRVPLQTRIAANAATQKDPNLPADTEMFNLAGDYGNAFFESFHDNNVFSQYLFNYWQYTDYYGTWHGQPTANVPKSLYDEKAQSD